MHPKIVASAVFVLSCFLVCARGSTTDEAAALDTLLNRVKLDGIYANRLPISCMIVITERVETAYVQFALREKHDAKCGGDPGVAPIVDRYRVHRSDNHLEWYDVVKDVWLPYSPGSVH